LPDGSLIVGDYDTSLLRGVDPARSVTKSAFDGPVACFMDVQEAIFDHGFERLGLGGAGVAHPVVCTEPLLAPPSARARLAELLFETYGVPSLAFGADAAFAWAHAAPTPRGAAGTGIVACVGHSSSTILPILNGVPVNAAAVRLDVAGLTVTQYLMDLLRVNFPEFGPALGGGIFARSEELKHALCHVAADYASEAAAYTAVARSCIGRGGGAAASDDKSRNDANGSQASQRRFAPGSTVRVQLPWVPKTVKAGAQPLSEEDIQRRETQRQANVRSNCSAYLCLFAHDADPCSSTFHIPLSCRLTGFEPWPPRSAPRKRR
jgi:Actin